MLYNSGFTTGIIATLFAIFFGVNDRLRESKSQSLYNAYSSMIE
jgi:hypothetical protein